MKKLVFTLPLLFISKVGLGQTMPAVAYASPSAPAFEPVDASAAAATSPAAEEPATLTGSRGFIKHNGWYVAPTFGATTLDGSYSSLVGLKGAWLINRQFGIGLAGNAFGWNTAEIDFPRPGTPVDGGYGGLLLQYVFASDKLVHGTVDATIGGGALCYQGAAGSRRDCNDAITFYVFEPTANVELNVTSWMRVAVGGGYRFAPIDDRSSLYKPELSGFVARTSIAFGQF